MAAFFLIREMVIPDGENSSKRALFHRNQGYAVAELFQPGPNWSSRNNSEEVVAFHGLG